MTPASSAAARGAQRIEVPWDAERSQRNLSRVHARRARRKAVARVLVGACGAGVLGALLLGGFRAAPTEPAPRSSAVVPPSVLGPSPTTTFADGSVAHVSEGGELVVKLASPERIESVLTTGAAEFEVTRHPERDFVVVAGPVRVRVVGTHFRVERQGERTRVSVSRGKVEVQEGARSSFLEAGESRFFPSHSVEPPAQPPAPSSTSSHWRFVQLARGGNFRAAYQVLSQSPSAVGSSAEELMLAADAARLSHHPQEATVYLRRVTREHPADSRAPLAAFTLGRVLLSQLGRPAEAADAFALARRSRPSGGLAEDALAREAEARQAAGASVQARSLAAQYCASYPRGKYLPSMQALATAQ